MSGREPWFYSAELALDAREAAFQRRYDSTIVWFRIGAIVVLATALLLARDVLPGVGSLLAIAAASLILHVMVALPLLRWRWSNGVLAGFVIEQLTVLGYTLVSAFGMGFDRSVTPFFLMVGALISLSFAALTLRPIASLVFTSIVASVTTAACLVIATGDVGPFLLFWLAILTALGIVWCSSYGSDLRLKAARAAYHALELQNQETVLQLARIVEARDEITGNHLHRVFHYTHAISLARGLPEAEANAIAEASYTHDIGKAYVPDAILKKAGPLTLAERAVMERHTLDGERFLGDRPSFSAHRTIARWRHERWNGAGYPDGLRGDEIPLSARIVAVADVYDALTSARPYKQAWDEDDAVAEIIRCSGTQFDPAVVRAFCAAVGSGVIARIRRELADPHLADELPIPQRATG